MDLQSKYIGRKYNGRGYCIRSEVISKSIRAPGWQSHSHACTASPTCLWPSLQQRGQMETPEGASAMPTDRTLVSAVQKLAAHTFVQFVHHIVLRMLFHPLELFHVTASEEATKWHRHRTCKMNGYCLLWFCFAGFGRRTGCGPLFFPLNF